LNGSTDITDLAQISRMGKNPRFRKRSDNRLDCPTDQWNPSW